MGEVIDPQPDVEATLEDLFGLLVRAKQRVKLATEHLAHVEGLVLARIVDKPDRGRVKLEGGPIQATIEFKFNYSGVNVEAIRALGPWAADLLKERKPELDASAYEALRESDPARFAQVARFVTARPAKPSFELKV